MTLCYKLIALAAGLPFLAAAADPEMINLVMPDACVVIDINIANIATSPIGAAMGEAFNQGVASQLKGELSKAKPQFQEQIAGLTKIDWTRDVREVMMAVGKTQSPPALIMVRSGLDPARIQALKAFTGNSVEYDGVTMLVSDKPGNGVVAFLDNSLIVIGQQADVEAAIRRRTQRNALSPALAAQVAKYSQYDLWVAFAGPIGPWSGPAKGKGNGPSAQAAQILETVAGFNGGLRFNPDLDVSADIEARTEKAASDMAQGLRWLTSTVESQAKQAGKGASGLENLKYQMTGKHILLSLHVPEAQILARMRQMPTAQVPATLAASPAPVAARPVPHPAPSSGLPPPPPGTIRVQSSEGTVLLPVGQQ